MTPCLSYMLILRFTIFNKIIYNKNRVRQNAQKLNSNPWRRLKSDGANSLSMIEAGQDILNEINTEEMLEHKIISYQFHRLQPNI